MRETRNQSKISVEQGPSLTYTDITREPGRVPPERRARGRRGSGDGRRLLAGLLLLLVLASWPDAVNAWWGGDADEPRRDADAAGG